MANLAQCFLASRCQKTFEVACDRFVSQTTHSLFFVQDNLSGMKFLVDSCSMVSIIPKSGATITVSNKPGYNDLFALNSAEVRTFGKCSLSIDIGLKKLFQN